MPYWLDDTIAAIATGAGGAPSGIVRLSGSSTGSIVERLFRPDSGEPALSGQTPSAAQGTIKLGGHLEGEFESGLLLPTLLYYWPTARSYTRQKAAELHTLGSPPLLEALLGHCCRFGARLAEPGEFTLRAFLGGRLDLTQAEAVLGVIEATGRAELDASLEQLAGGLARPLAHLRESLLEMLAHLEAGLDFVEEDMAFIEPAELQARLTEAAAEVQRLADQLRTRGELAPHAAVVLAGLPNVGKSSLFNALCQLNARPQFNVRRGRAEALVSPEAGTTRDYLTTELELGGVPCRVVDTAGTASESDLGAIDRAAQSLSRQQRRSAKLTLVCLDVTRPPSAAEIAELEKLEPATTIVVWTKCDAAADAASPATIGSLEAIRTSAHRGDGLGELGRRIELRLRAADESSSGARSTAARCGDSLRLAGESLDRAIETSAQPGTEELAAAEIRCALDELGRVAGTVYTDDILDRVFSRFCIGK